MPRLTLTDIQQKIYLFIERTIQKTGIPPSIKEISQHSGLSSSSSVHHQLTALETKGYIKRNKTKSRSIILTKPREKKSTKTEHEPEQALSLQPELNSGIIEYPLIFFDNNLTPICKDVWRLPLKFTETTDAFLYAVENDELSEIGIYKNDVVLIEYNDAPSSGELVMAVCQGRIVLRELLNENDYFILLPHNRELYSTKHNELTFIGSIKKLFRFSPGHRS